jgi:phage minor structural protein
MLTLYTGSGAVPLNVDSYYIRQLASGLDELCFEVSIWDEAFQAIQEESSILEQSDSTDASYYLVKAIDAGTETANVKCQIDLDEWKASLIVNYKSASLSVAAMVRSVAPAGWTVTDESGLTYQRTIELTSATPLDVLEQCRETFNGVTYRFDNVNKVLTIVNMANGQNLGAFVTRDLNLKENNYKGKSTGFATRLYAYGKDGLSFASINGGKPYVDNNTYSSRVICAFWKDERYTVAANLLAAAIERLETMAVPQRSFDCDVVDLAATNPEKYAELDFKLFSRCILIDQTRSGAQIVHIIVERWIYPYLPQKNKVVLSTVPPRIQAQVTQIINSLNNQNSIYQQQQSSAQQNAIENATEQITGAKGGYMRAIYDNDGNWTELVVMNTENILTASKLWRFNLGGFGYSPYGYNGPYTTAITMDGAIVADFITTGTLDASKANVTNLNASNIKTGTLDASVVTVSNLNASNITAGTLNVDRINAKSITGAKIADNTITGGASGNIAIGTLTGGVDGGGVATGNLAASTIRGGNIASSTVTGGSSGNLSSSTITTDNTVSGINTNLGYAANYGNATAYQGAAGPTYFNVGQTLTVGGAIVMGGAGFTPKWSSTLNAYYLGSGGEG